ncbi:MAG: hypothetical protein K0S93_2446 [Nitrososphaeraceae archaeon]|nr:hypothetical protein [Nitrososphaeraceae archaeon]
MKYISRNFQLKIMLNSKHILYTISSGILMVMVLLSPLYNIKAQEENEKSDPLTILSNIRNLLDKAITELNKGNYTGASVRIRSPWTKLLHYILI